MENSKNEKKMNLRNLIPLDLYNSILLLERDSLTSFSRVNIQKIRRIAYTLLFIFRKKLIPLQGNQCHCNGIFVFTSWHPTVFT